MEPLSVKRASPLPFPLPLALLYAVALYKDTRSCPAAKGRGALTRARGPAAGAGSLCLRRTSKSAARGTGSRRVTLLTSPPSPAVYPYTLYLYLIPLSLSPPLVEPLG